MVRYVVTFLIGLVLGASSLFLFLQSSGRLMIPGDEPVVAVEPNRVRRVLTRPRGRGALPAQPTGIAVSEEPADDVEDPAEVTAGTQQKPLTAPAAGGGITDNSVAIPVAGTVKTTLRDHFNDSRGGRVHEAIDIMAPRGRPVIAAVDGKIKKLFLSVAGGITIYQFDTEERFVYYYAHLDKYAPDLREGMLVRKGEVIGYVGSTGNANPAGPHLHFSIAALPPSKEWWKGVPVNPYPILMQRGVTYVGQ